MPPSPPFATVSVHPGVQDPDTGHDIGGWRGRIVDEMLDDAGQTLVTIEWDSLTLEAMPAETILANLFEGLDWTHMVLYAHEVGPAEPRDTPDAVENTRRRLTAHYRQLAYAQMAALAREEAEGTQTHAATVPASPPAPRLPAAIRETLAALPLAELLDLLVELAGTHDTFRRLLLGRVPITPQTIAAQPRDPAQVRALTARLVGFFAEISQPSDDAYRDEFDDEYEDEFEDDEEDGFDDEEDVDEDGVLSADAEAELTTIFELTQLLHPLDRLEIYWAVLTGAEAAEVEEYAGSEAIERALTRYTEVCQLQAPTPADRQPHLLALVDALGWRISDMPAVTFSLKCAIDRLATTPEDLRLVSDRLRRANEARFADWITAYFIQLGDDAQYLEVRQAHLVTEAQHGELASFWERRGEPARSIATLERFVTTMEAYNWRPPYDQYGYAPRFDDTLARLEAAYRTAGDAENLCRILLTRVRAASLTLDLYRQIKACAIPLGIWAEVQPDLLARAKRTRDTLAEILLEEGDWDGALALAQEKSTFGISYFDNVQVLVARGVKAHRPREALQIFQTLVQSHINGQNRPSYEVAARYAADVKAIYLDILNEADTWKRYIADLRARYPRHRALQEEFRKL
jgi:hypothetical protein